jgi:hypothetical protein
MTVILRRPVIKRCPFRPETDAGTLTITLPGGPVPELHSLDDRIDALCADPISHEEFTAFVAAVLPADAVVTTKWNTGAWDVEVTETTSDARWAELRKKVVEDVVDYDEATSNYAAQDDAAGVERATSKRLAARHVLGYMDELEAQS